MGGDYRNVNMAKVAKALLPVVVEAELIEGNTVETALRKLLEDGFAPVYMPEIIDGRIRHGPEDAPENWGWLTAPSIKATGWTKAGIPVVIYAHVQNYFSDPDNIAQAVSRRLVNGAGIMPDEEFYRLVDLAKAQQGKLNQRVFLADYDALKRAPSGVVAVKDALQHPQTIPFLGGQKRAEQYLIRHEQVLGNRIGIWHVDDLIGQANQGDVNVGRVLRVGGYGRGLVASDYLTDYARFAVVRQAVAVGAGGAAPRSLEAIL